MIVSGPILVAAPPLSGNLKVPAGVTNPIH
jgi:hypothetical protein